MKANDYSAIAAVGVLAAAIAALLSNFGVAVPIAVPAAVPVIATLVIVGLRGYVAAVGENNTSLDERIDAVERAVEAMRQAFPPEPPTKKEGKHG